MHFPKNGFGVMCRGAQKVREIAALVILHDLANFAPHVIDDLGNRFD
jgi:hypothetical protein